MSGLMCGSLGASRLGDAIARTKTGWSSSRANLMGELICERLTGQRYETYSNANMQRGLEMEPMARTAYEFYADASVALTDPIQHPRIEWSHASPDGLVGAGGLVEIKCPMTSTHLASLRHGEIDGKYLTQMQWQMAVTGRNWCDFASYDPRLPEPMRLFVKRVPRDDARIAELERLVVEFLAELDAEVSVLRSRYQLADVLREAAA